MVRRADSGTSTLGGSHDSPDFRAIAGLKSSQMDIPSRSFESGGNSRRIHNRVSEDADIFRIAARSKTQAEGLVIGPPCYITHYLDEVLSRIPKDLRLISKTIAQLMTDGSLHLARAANALGVSPRTLQWRLKSYRIDFKELVEDTLRSFHCRKFDYIHACSHLTVSTVLACLRQGFCH